MHRLLSLKSGPSVPPTPFCQIASDPLDSVSYGGSPHGDYIRLSGVLQVCVYLYETGAVLGRARRDEAPKLLEVLVDQDNEDCRPGKLRWTLRTRLERTSRQCKSLSTFYLYRTMRIMGLDFTVEGMKQAHNEPRMRGESGNPLTSPQPKDW